MRLTAWLISVLFLPSIQAQVFERLDNPVERNIPDCYLIGYNLMRLIPEYYQAEKWDSLGYAIEQYNKYCLPADHFRHFSLLNAVATGNFNRVDYPELLELILHYRDNQQHSPSAWDHPYQYRQAWLKAHRDYYDFLKSWSGEELHSGNYDGIDSELLSIYAGNWQEFKDELKSGSFPDSTIQLAYQDRLRELIYEDEFSLELFTGIWMPQSNLGRLGNHPIIGLGASGFTGGFRFNASFALRFLKAPDDYRVRRYDSIFVDDYFSSIYFGFEVYRSLYRDLRNDISVGLGVGYDGITFHTYGGNSDLAPETLNSFNLNIGLGYSFYYNYQNFVRLEGRYNFVNFRNNINDDLAGDAIALRLIFGFTDNSARRKLAKDLK